MTSSTLLPDYHKDPFDRLMVAQANQNNLLIVTKDNNIDKYEMQRKTCERDVLNFLNELNEDNILVAYLAYLSEIIIFYLEIIHKD